MYKKLCKHLIVLTATTAASIANANLLVNGDFENPHLAPGAWSVFSSISGWTTSSGPGIEIENNTIVTAQSGQQYVELDSHANSSMAQTITGLSVGNNYDLSFWYRARTNNLQNDNGINMYWGDTSPGDLNLAIANVTANQGGWTEYLRTLTATDSTMYLGFAAVGLNNSLGGFIDNVQLTAARPVPEPVSLGLFSLGFLGLMAARRKA